MDDFKWCLDGLPKQSTIAISSNGVLNEAVSMQVFIDGVHILQEILSPTTLLINTKSMESLSLIDDIKQYNNIIFYNNIGQRRRKGFTKHLQKTIFDLFKTKEVE